MAKNPAAVLTDFQLSDLNGNLHSFSEKDLTLLCFVKEDCPTCRLVVPLLEHWQKAFGARISVLLIGQTLEGNRKFAAETSELVILDDSDLELSFESEIEIVPTLFWVDQGQPADRLTGFAKREWQELEKRISTRTRLTVSQIDWDALPELRPGCGSLSADPAIAGKLAARLEPSTLSSRRIEIGREQDEFEFLFEQGFTDGLPVVPPSPERVRAMLQGTSRSPREVVAIVPPNMGKATVEKVAINAVMAGCLPPYLPVVLASLEAVCTDDFNIHGVMATTMGASPVVVVNGPIRKQIEMNMGQGALGQGNRANATIGRALRLALANVGGAKPGGIERATFSNPMKFTMCFAEWEEISPWEPLHVERGFQSTDSVVTVFGMTSGPVLAVDQTSRTAEQLGGSLALCVDSALHPRAHCMTDVLMVISPEHAKTFAKDGYLKDDLRRRIQSVTAVSRKELLADEVSGVGLDPDAARKFSQEELSVLVPKFANAEAIQIVIAGGTAGKFSAIFHGWSSGPRGTQPVSRKIEEVSR